MPVAFSVSFVSEAVKGYIQTEISIPFSFESFSQATRNLITLPEISIPFSSEYSSQVLKNLIELSVNVIGAGYGKQFTEGIEFEDIVDFVTDYYSLKYLSRQAGVTKKDVIKVVLGISNLLRNCEMYGINEVFMGSVRIKKAKGKNYWVIIER